jgi:hypothetical protein
MEKRKALFALVAPFFAIAAKAKDDFISRVDAAFKAVDSSTEEMERLVAAMGDSKQFESISLGTFIAIKESMTAAGGGLQEKAIPLIEERYPYAGIVSVNDRRDTLPNPFVDVRTISKAKEINRAALSRSHCNQLLKSMSATLCRTLDEVQNWRARLEDANAKIKQLESSVGATELVRGA